MKIISCNKNIEAYFNVPFVDTRLFYYYIERFVGHLCACVFLLVVVWGFKNC